MRRFLISTGSFGKRDAETVNELAMEYLERWARPRKRSAHEDERALKADVLPIFGNKKAKDISRRDIIILLDGIVNRGSPIQANRTLTIIRKMFQFAVRRGILEKSPCMEIERPSPERPRERVLTEDELRNFWLNLDKANMSEGMRLALRLQVLTATRRGEVANAEWKDINREKMVWVIPSEKFKTKRQHSVPLSPQAMKILNEAKELSRDSMWVFPTPHYIEDKPITGSAINRAVTRNLGIFGVEKFVPHDLRRTEATFMTSMGIPATTVSKVLGHVEGGVTAIYEGTQT